MSKCQLLLSCHEPNNRQEVSQWDGGKAPTGTCWQGHVMLALFHTANIAKDMFTAHKGPFSLLILVHEEAQFISLHYIESPNQSPNLWGWKQRCVCRPPCRCMQPSLCAMSETSTPKKMHWSQHLSFLNSDQLPVSSIVFHQLESIFISFYKHWPALEELGHGQGIWWRTDELPALLTVMTSNSVADQLTVTK